MLRTLVGEADNEVLTDRQREVGQLLAAHLSHKEIARELGISPKTVERHVSEIKRRLGVGTKREIAQWLEGALPGQGRGNPAVRKTPLQTSIGNQPNVGTDEPHALREWEAGAVNFIPSMPTPGEPRIVPGLLDGKYRVLVRFAVIAGIVMGVLIAIILAVAAIRSVTEMVETTTSKQALERS